MSNRILSDSSMTALTRSSDLFVLTILADQANDDGICWPSVGSLMERTGYSDRTVELSLRRLQEEKHISLAARRYGPGRTFIYSIHPVLCPVKVAERERRRAARSGGVSLNSAAGFLVPETGGSPAKKGDPPSPKGDPPSPKGDPPSPKGDPPSEKGDPPSEKGDPRSPKPIENQKGTVSVNPVPAGDTHFSVIASSAQERKFPAHYSEAGREALRLWDQYRTDAGKRLSEMAWNSLLSLHQGEPETHVIRAIHEAIAAGWGTFHPKPPETRERPAAEPVKSPAAPQPAAAPEEEAALMATLFRLYPEARPSLTWRELDSRMKREIRQAHAEASAAASAVTTLPEAQKPRQHEACAIPGHPAPVSTTRLLPALTE